MIQGLKMKSVIGKGLQDHDAFWIANTMLRTYEKGILESVLREHLMPSICSHLSEVPLHTTHLRRQETFNSLALMLTFCFLKTKESHMLL